MKMCSKILIPVFAVLAFAIEIHANDEKVSGPTQKESIGKAESEFRNQPRADVVDLADIWTNSRKDEFLVLQTGNRITWDGSGVYDGKKWSHKGEAILDGRTLKGKFVDNPDSAFHPNSREISGAVSADGKSVVWDSIPNWVRK